MRWNIFWVTLLFPSLIIAAPCGIHGDPAGRFAANGQEYTVPNYVENCERLEVRRGPVRICHTDRLFRHVCRQLKTGEVFSSDKSASEADSGLLSLFRALPLRVSGGTRGGSSSLPHGLILLPQAEATYALPSGTTAFKLEDAANEKKVDGFRVQGGKLVLSAKALQAGRVYHWELRGQLGVQQGVFEVADITRQTAMEARLRDGLVFDDAVSADLARASLLHAEGFEFDAERAMNR